MNVIRGLRNIKRFKNPVVAMGVFDGVHRAHQRILRAAVAKARAIGGISIVLTFDPHPQKEDRISSLEHRLQLMDQLGIQVAIVLQFNKQFAKISADDFIRDILVRRISVDYVYVGKNFRFGESACGDVRLLRRYAEVFHFKLKVFPVITLHERSVSSTYIRRLIVQGKLSRAQRLLGRPVSILGTVIHGTAWGRRLGFPTANLNPHHEVLPPAGIYAVLVKIEQKKYKGVCYIGRKPIVGPAVLRYSQSSQLTIEVTILNFNENIYGKYIEVQFLKKIRNEQQFLSSALLIKQIKKDIIKAKEHFSRHSF
ncbi:MAG: bifunctional riboflavin kinase/FAD synthetase [Candidatus Omnitrophica bacterium]|nr:bifunctional riboflavin kinase/FAD synthetase [Candidatus Omnitrophota bacterium]